MEILMWFFPAVLAFLIIRYVFRIFKKRNIRGEIPKLMRGNFSPIQKPHLHRKIAAVEKIGEKYEIHDFHWKLPRRLQARLAKELGTIVLIVKDTTNSTRQYKESAILFPSEREIDVRQVRWKVTIFDVIDKKVSELGVFIGNPPSLIEENIDSNIHIPQEGEDPAENVLTQLHKLSIVN